MGKQNGNRLLRWACVALIALIVVAATPATAANLVLVNLDPPGLGLNDPTPAAPVGGNPGTTLGEQRTNVYNLAMQIWGATVASNATVFIGATFQPLPCSPTGAVLGAAGATFVFANFPGSTFPNTWFGSALADSLAGADLNPGFIDIISFFNSDIDDDPNCLVGRTWYYGFDNNQGGDIDFLSVVLHEIAHGLGFQNFANEASGTLLAGLPDIYTKFSLDLTTGKTWDIMSDAERQTSAVNTGNVVWNGPSVTAAAPGALGPRPSALVLTPPLTVGDSYEAQAASFGPALTTSGGTTGKMVVADDGVGVGTDACEPIQNNLNGKIAIVDRGACAFVTKVLNAQIAGAKGVIVVNNLPKGLPPMGGASSAVTIPSVGVTMDDGNMFKDAADGNAESKLILDEDFLAGVEGGFVRLYAPDPVQLGSSISHWDTTATPSLLMEPSITPNLESAVDLDLTPFLFEDIGWVLLP
jgi:hypothetical protein